jgi:hypothetical protein
MLGFDSGLALLASRRDAILEGDRAAVFDDHSIEFMIIGIVHDPSNGRRATRVSISGDFFPVPGSCRSSIDPRSGGNWDGGAESGSAQAGQRRGQSGRRRSEHLKATRWRMACRNCPADETDHHDLRESPDRVKLQACPDRACDMDPVLGSDDWRVRE